MSSEDKTETTVKTQELDQALASLGTTFEAIAGGSKDDLRAALLALEKFDFVFVMKVLTQFEQRQLLRPSKAETDTKKRFRVVHFGRSNVPAKTEIEDITEEELKQTVAEVMKRRCGVDVRRGLRSQSYTDVFFQKDVLMQDVFPDNYVLDPPGQTETVSISSLAPHQASNLLQYLGLTVVTNTSEEIDAWPASDVTPFVWQQESEASESARAKTYFEATLRSLKVPQRNGYAVHDARGLSQLLSSRFGHFSLRGTCDAIVVPYKTSSESFARQLRAVIDWKRRDKLPPANGQWVGELLGAVANSVHPVLLIFTDLQTFYIWQLRGKTIQSYPNVRANKAFPFIAKYLITVCSPEPAFEPGFGLPDPLSQELVDSHLAVKQMQAVDPVSQQIESLLDSSSSFQERVRVTLDLAGVEWRSMFG